MGTWWLDSLRKLSMQDVTKDAANENPLCHRRAPLGSAEWTGSEGWGLSSGLKQPVSAWLLASLHLMVDPIPVSPSWSPSWTHMSEILLASCDLELQGPAAGKFQFTERSLASGLYFCYYYIYILNSLVFLKYCLVDISLWISHKLVFFWLIFLLSFCKLVCFCHLILFLFGFWWYIVILWILFIDFRSSNYLNFCIWA